MNESYTQQPFNWSVSVTGAIGTDHSFEFILSFLFSSSFVNWHDINFKSDLRWKELN